MIKNIVCEDVLTALKSTSKGRLTYDRNWKEERRTQVITKKMVFLNNYLN